MLIVFVLGSVALEVAETDGRPPLHPEEIRIEERLAALGAVDPAAFPRTAETATVSAGWVSSAQFAWARPGPGRTRKHGTGRGSDRRLRAAAQGPVPAFKGRDDIAPIAVSCWTVSRTPARRDATHPDRRLSSVGSRSELTPHIPNRSM